MAVLKKGSLQEQLWAIFQSNFEKIENGFFKKLLSIAPNLSQQELKHCAFIRMNFETKDIAAMFQVKPSSIQIARVRMKKKFNLSQDDLINFILLI